ncbi:MAG: hypothetical protein QM820_60100 [Minicystis sp.]
MHRFARAGRAGAGCLLAISMIGCAVETQPEPPPRGTVVKHVLARVQPSRRALTFERVTEAGPALGTQSVDSLSVVQDGTPGSGPASTVELVTNTVGDTFAGDACPGVAAGTKAFCANVSVNHFYPRPLSNVFVQVTSIVDGSFQPLGAHQAFTSDPSAMGLDNSLGLWRYTTPGGAPGVIGAAPDNGAARDWVFQNPDDADTFMSLRVVASLTYASYTRTAANLPFVDACAAGTNLGTPLTSLVDLPFPFTLYDTTATQVTVNRRGVLLMGPNNGQIAPSKSVALPASGNVPACTLFTQCTVPKPAIFPFWDALTYLGTGAVCTETSGAAPGRTFAVTWSHVGRNSLADVDADYSFTVVLHEGTDVIDLLYGQMLGPLPNAAGGSATVGVQNAAGTVATAEWKSSNYGTGTSYTLTPVP